MRHLLCGFKTSLYNCIPNFDKYLSYKCIVQFLTFRYLVSKYLMSKLLWTLLILRNTIENKIGKLFALKEHIT